MGSRNLNTVPGSRSVESHMGVAVGSKSGLSETANKHVDSNLSSLPPSHRTGYKGPSAGLVAESPFRSGSLSPLGYLGVGCPREDAHCVQHWKL